MRANPERCTDPEPERPRSWSMTITCSLAHPSAQAFSTKAYWRAVDSRLFSTCEGWDWRIYTIAARCVWLDLTLLFSIMLLLRFLTDTDGLHDQPRQKFDRQCSWLVFQACPYSGLWNWDVQKVQKVLQRSGSPRLLILRRCYARRCDYGGEHRRLRVHAANPLLNRDGGQGLPRPVRSGPTHQGLSTRLV